MDNKERFPKSLKYYNIFIYYLEVFLTMAKIKLNKEEDIPKVGTSKEKRISGFGILKGMPSFKEEKEEHDEF